MLAGGQRRISDVPADAPAALDRPPSLWPPLRVLQHRPVAAAVGAEPVPPPKMTFSPVITSIDAERLCGSIPLTTRCAAGCTCVTRCSNLTGCRAGRAPLLRAEQTPLEPLPALA